MKIFSYHLIFRIACAMCFIGHGTFGFITKKVWCNYFAIFGIGEQLAYKLMPLVGTIDVLLGIILLVYPLRFAAVWLVLWGLFTAVLRPLSGEPFAELIERAGNFGAPLILLLLSLPSQSKMFGLMNRLTPDDHLTENRVNTIQKFLQLFGFLLLIGHGWLNLLHKPGLITQYTNLGFDNPANLSFYLGIFECVAACLILIKPTRSVVIIILIWKVMSETPYPAYALLEWIERGGSYGVLIGLWMILKNSYQITPSFFNLRHTKSPMPGL